MWSLYSKIRIPSVPHNHTNTIAFLHAQTYKSSGQGSNVTVKLTEVPGQVSLYTHVPCQRTTVWSRTFLWTDESWTLWSLRQYFRGEISGKGPVVERRVACALDGRKCNPTKAWRYDSDGVQHLSRVSVRLGGEGHLSFPLHVYLRTS
jgi:hypothetical protein